MRELELLSPAGDLNIFKSVINAGADAVYFGGDMFGARAYAKNFTIDEAKEAIKYAHIHKRKAYLTVNTLLKNPEIERDLYDYLKAYVENGIDAFIVQDFGVFNFIKEFFPETHIHVSTQASVCTKYGAKFFENLGASRIVTARELSLDEISDIYKSCPELEIEAFVHGALCVCYSGQCLMSSILGGRSGNRGRCAQPCRLPYDAYDSSNDKLNKKGNYILSPKDFCTIEYLPQMIEAGVMSFKIEGRMKQISYATGVVSVYRHYLDKYLFGGLNNYSVDEDDIQKLLDYGNRSGFTSLYLNNHNGKDMITFEAPGHTKVAEDKIDIFERKIPIKCKISARLNKDFSITFYDDFGNEASVSAGKVEPAQKQPTDLENIKKAVSGLGNTSFKLDSIIVDSDDNIFLPVSTIKNARREALEKFEAVILNSNIKKINDFIPLAADKNDASNPKTFVTVKTEDQLDVVCKHHFVESIGVPIKLVDKAKSAFEGKIFLQMPPVLRKGKFISLAIFDEVDGVIVSSFDQVGLLLEYGYSTDKIILDSRLYTFNNRSIKGFNDLTLAKNCIPYELSLKELVHRNNTNSQMIVYGYIPLMITANCTVKNTSGCDKSNKLISLVDRKNATFNVACDCDNCINTIYNSKKYICFDMKDQIKNLGIAECRLDFTIESKEETSKILQIYDDVFNKGLELKIKEDYTRGHLKRGVE